MFVRSIKVPGSSGVVHEYVRVVESIRENGRVKQRVVLNLGRRDTLMTLLPLLQRKATPCRHSPTTGRCKRSKPAPGGLS